jgi:hypothetical protein
VKINPDTENPGWDVSFWFAVSKPLLGVLFGNPGLSDFLSVTEAMSITPIIFALIILLFRFDSTLEIRRQRSGEPEGTTTGYRPQP